jgi:hypothetical protein
MSRGFFGLIVNFLENNKVVKDYGASRKLKEGGLTTDG